MRCIIRLLLPILLAWICAISQASCDTIEKEYNVVKLEVKRGGKVLGRPTFVVQIGSTAVATNTDENGYSVKIKLDYGTAANKDSRDIAIELYTATQDKWKLVGAPVLSALLNSITSLSIGDDAASDAFSVKVLVEDHLGSGVVANFGKNRCSAARLAFWKESMSRPVSWLKKISDQPGSSRCCTLCKFYTCCSDGPMCCDDLYKCPGKNCCNPPQ